MVAAVNKDYKDDQIQLQTKKKQQRDTVRTVREAEWAESDRLQAEKLVERKQARQNVENYLANQTVET